MKKRILSFVLIIAIVLGMIPTSALTANAVTTNDFGDFSVTTTTGSQPTYSTNTLRFSSSNAGGTYVISMKSGVTESLRSKIVVNGGTSSNPINITLNNVSIKFTDGVSETNVGTAAFDIQNSSVVNLTLSGQNNLTSGFAKAGLQINGATNVLPSVTIGGNGKLTVTGGNQGAGIGGSLNRGTGIITINSGIINTTGGAYAAGIGDGDSLAGDTSIATIPSIITINGGDITATGGIASSGIGTTDQLENSVSNMKIYLYGGKFAITGGDTSPWNNITASAIGAGSASKMNVGNIKISKGVDLKAYARSGYAISYDKFDSADISPTGIDAYILQSKLAKNDSLTQLPLSVLNDSYTLEKVMHLPAEYISFAVSVPSTGKYIVPEVGTEFEITGPGINNQDGGTATAQTTFVGNGGTWTGNVLYKFTNNKSAPLSPQRTNYSFKGWSTASDSTTIVTTYDLYKTYYAVWEPAKVAETITIAPNQNKVFNNSPITAGKTSEVADIKYSYKGDGTPIVKWYKDNAGSIGTTITTAPTDAGTYWIGVAATQGTNSAAVSEQHQKFIISAKTVDTADFNYDLAAKDYNGLPQGITVTPKDNNISNVVVKYNGSETVPTLPGDYTITLDSKGGTNYKPITNLNIGSYTINKVTPTVTVTSNKNPSVYGDEITITATVSSVNGTVPTGTINFTAAGFNMPNVAIDNTGKAVLKTKDIGVLTNENITANYSGDNIYKTTSNSVNQTIDPKPVTFDITGKTPIFDNTVKKITVTPSALTQSDFAVKYYAVDPDTNLVDFTTEVKTPRTFGKYVYVIDFASSQPNYAISNKASITYSANQSIPTGGNVGIMEIVVNTPPSKTNTTIAMKDIASVNYKENIKLSATVSQTGGSKNITGTVTFLNGTDVIGTANVQNGVADYTWIKPYGGTYDNITALYSGDANYEPSQTTQTKSVKVSAIEQKITAPDVVKHFGDSDFSLNATTNGDGELTYTTTSDVVSIVNNNFIKINKAGTATINVTANATDNYKMSNKTIAVTVLPMDLVVFTVDTKHQYDGNSKGISVASYPVLNPNMFSVNYKQGGTNVTNPTNVGIYNYTVSLSDNNYKIVSGQTGTMEIAESVQKEINFTNQLVNKNYGDTDYTLAATGNEIGTTITYKSSDDTVAKVDNNGKVTILKPGTVTITATATKPGYADAVSSYVLVVNKKQVIVTAEDKTKTYGDVNPDFTYLLTDAESSKITGTAKYNTNATQYSPVNNTYIIEVEGLTSDYYDFVYKKGILKIEKRKINVSPSITKKYDGETADTITTLNFGNVVNGDLVTGSATVNYSNANVGIQNATLSNIIIDIGRENYELVTNPTKNVTADIEKAEVTFTGSNNVYYYDANSKSANVAANSNVTGLPVSNENFDIYYNNSTALPTEVGTYTVSAQIKAGTNYTSGKITVGTLEIKPSSQTQLTINGIPSNTIQYGDSFTLTNTGGSGTGNVKYEVVSGNATIDSNGVVTVTGTGDVTVKVTKASDNNFKEQTATATFKADKKVITAKASPTDRSYIAGNKTVDVSVDLIGVINSNDVTVTADGNMQTDEAGLNKIVYISNLVLRGTDSDKYTFADNYTPTAYVNIDKIADSISIKNVPAKTFGDNDFSLILTDGIGSGQITYSSDNSSVASVDSNGIVKVIGVGNATITATKLASANYNQATTNTNITVNAKSVDFDITDASKTYTGNSQYPVVKPNIFGLAEGIDYKVEYKQNGKSVVPKSVGNYDVTVTILNNNYTGSKTGIFEITQAEQLQLAITGVPQTVVYGDKFTLNTTGGTNTGNVKYEVVSGNAVIDSNGVVTVTGVGPITVKATKSMTNFADETATVKFNAQKKIVTVNAIATDKIYDGNTNIDVALTLNNTLPTDTVTVTAIGNTINADVESKKTVNISKIVLSDNTNYTLSDEVVQATATITEKTITASVKVNSKIYDGTTVAVANATLIDTVAGDSVSAVADAYFTDSETGNNKELNYTLSLVGPKAKNYKLNETSGTANADITQATVLFKSSDDTFIYDGNAHKANISAVVENTTLPFTDYTVKYSSTTDLIIDVGVCDVGVCDVGVYDVDVEITNNNYKGLFNPTTITISQRNQTPLSLNGIPNSQISYKDTFKLNAIGGNGNGSITYSSSDANIAVVDKTTGKVKIVGVGDFTITATKASDGNYAEQNCDVQLTSYKKKINIDAVMTSLVYNGKEQGIKITSNDVDFDTSDISAIYHEVENPMNTTPKDIGTYRAEVSVSADNKYYVSDSVVGYFTITKAPITVKVANKEKTYGDANPEFTLSYTLLGNDTNSDITEPILSCIANEKSPAGKYEIAASGELSKNYDAIYENGILTINKKPLTITAQNKEKSYSKENPIGTVTYNGFVNGENETVLAGTLAFTFGNIVGGITTEASGNKYEITASGLSSDNYAITFISGKLTVNPLFVSVTAGTANTDYFVLSLNEKVGGLSAQNINVTLDGKQMAITSVQASDGNQTYIVEGLFEAFSKHIVTITSSNYIFATVEIIPTSQSSGGGNNHNGGNTTTPTYTITVIQGIGGKISPATVDIDKNDSKTFTITANEGYEIADVLVDGKSIGAVFNYTFDNVTANSKITAKFNKTENSNKTEWENPFDDVNTNDWFYDGVEFANKNNLMNGTNKNTFSPYFDTTRAMFTTIVYRIEKEPNADVSKFIDVNSDDYFAKAVAWGEKHIVVKGISDTEFAPNVIITREQMVAILYRYANYKGYDTSKSGDASLFVDGDEVYKYAKEAMAWAIGNNLIQGKSGKIIDPHGSATRAEVVTVLQRFVANFVK